MAPQDLIRTRFTSGFIVVEDAIPLGGERRVVKPGCREHRRQAESVPLTCLVQLHRVYDQNLYPSQERVRLLLTKPGSIKEPGALAAWHEALQDLGLENKVPSSHLLPFIFGSIKVQLKIGGITLQ